MSVSYNGDFGPRDGLARWQSRDGKTRYVPATTMCWRPRYPQVRRAYREGAETILRCGDCPGCREFERLLLQRRLVETYRAIAAAASSPELTEAHSIQDRAWRPGATLFIVQVECSADDRAALLRRVRRCPGVAVERGFVLEGVNALAVLSARPAELVVRLRRGGRRVDVWEMSDPTKLKSWRHFTRGLTVARSAYGENINRFYRRGLKPRDKEKWEVRKLDAYRTFNKATDPRVDFESYGRLVPPRMWELQDPVSVDARKLIDKADSPEAVVEALRPVFERLDRMGKRGSISVESTSPEQIDRNRRAYQHVARMETEHIVNAKLSEFPPPPLLEEVTELLDNSSPVETSPAGAIHSSGAPPPALEPWMEEELRLRRAGEQERKARSDRNSKKKVHDAIERLRELVDRRKGKDD